MTAKIIDFDAARIAPQIIEAIAGFCMDPPDSEYQRGYLAALCHLYREGLGRGKGDDRLAAAERLLRITEKADT